MNKLIDDGEYIELRGGRDLLCEGCRGILTYEETRILVELSDKKLDIRGNKLRLRFLAEDRIAVCGEIISVTYV